MLCLLLGVAYAWFMYRVGRRGGEGMSTKLRILLSVLRTVSVTMIAMLLLGPLVRRESALREKPIIITLEDDSRSVVLCGDSTYYRGPFREELSALAADLGGDYEVHRYRYGSELNDADDDSTLYMDDYTDMSGAIDEIAQRYYHRNIGALILTGDGIFNHGSSPVSSAAKASIPIYTVAMGDTTVYPDAAIVDVRCNRVVHKGNSFPMDVTMTASKLGGRGSTLVVKCDGRRVFSKDIKYDGQDYSASETAVLEAEREGIHTYTVELVAVDGERSVVNNRRTVTVEVIDSRRKVAIIHAVPHPDVAAIRAAVESNIDCEADVFLARDFKGKATDYSLLVLHQLPCKVREADIDIAKLLSSGVPVLFVLGSQSDIARFNALRTGLEIISRIDRQNEATALADRNFTYFSTDNDDVEAFESFPPLTTPFGEYRMSGNSQSLFTARIGNVNSRQPLVAMTQSGNRRNAFIAGEGLWRWRMADYQRSGSHSHFDRMVSKVMTFIALQPGDRHLMVQSQRRYSPDQSVIIEAQLYNDNFESVNNIDVKFTLRGDSIRGEKDYLFGRNASGYTLNIGPQPAGVYSYEATARLGAEKYTATGSFVVERLDLEAVNTVADHAVMRTIAGTTGGEMVEAHDVGRLSDMLHNRDDLHTIIYRDTRYTDLLNVPLLFVLIIVLLSVEWVVRKYNGEV